MVEKKVRGRKRILRGILVAFFLGLLTILAGMSIVTSVSQAAVLRDDLDLKDKYCKEFDNLAPGIELVGESTIYLNIGEQYTEPGVEVYEHCSAADVTMAGAVDSSVPGEYEVTYSTKDQRDNVAEAVRKIIVRPQNSGVVYLTFDDGPGPYTEQLLDILAKYNVKATFFVTGAGSDDVLRREYNEGHAIGLHTFSHQYAYVYENMDNFFADLYAVQDRVRNVTGYTSNMMRFPGGSSNLVSVNYDGGIRIMSRLVKEVEARGFTYFDWNIVSGDAGGTTSTDEIVENVTSHLFHDGKSVVLQHDIKDYSVNAVERIIQYGLANGYSFDKLSPDSFTAHHGVNN